MDVFWNATEAFGNVLIDRMRFVGLEATFWFWFLFAFWMWVNNMRGWLRQYRRHLDRPRHPHRHRPSAHNQVRGRYWQRWMAKRAGTTPW